MKSSSDMESSKNDSIWTQSENLFLRVIFLVHGQPFGYTELTWYETWALPQTILWKTNSQFFVWETKSHHV